MTELSDEITSNPQKKCKNSVSTSTTITNEESLYWKDSDLKQFITMRFPQLDEEEEVNIACQFLTYLFTGHISSEINLPKLLFLTASFLRNPKDPEKKLFDSSEFDVRVKIFRNTKVYHADLFLDHLLRKLGGQDYSVTLFRESLYRLRGNGIVAYASFLATVILRISVKSPESVCDYIVCLSTKIFNDFFPMYSLQGSPPDIPIEIVRVFSQMSLSSHWLFYNFFAYVLAAYKRGSDENLIQSYLYESILRHTAYHGLRLFQNYKTFKFNLRLDTKAFRNCLFNDKAKESLDLLEDLCERYRMGENILWPWARLLKVNYFLEFRARDHLELNIILTALMENSVGSTIWNRMCLKNVTLDEKAKAKKFAKSIFNTIRKK